MAENKPADVRRKEILDISLKLFSKQGYSGTSVDHICKKSKITKGGLYWHFSSKKEILNTLVEELCSSQAEVWRKLENIEVGENTLSEVGLSFIKHNLESRDKNRFYSVLEMESFGNSDIKEALKVSMNLVHNSLISFAEKILKYYNNSTIDKESFAHIMEMTVSGIVHRKVLDVVEIDELKCWNILCDSIIKSLK